MGGGGSIGMMNATIKNNRKLLKRRKKLKEYYISGSSKFNTKTEYNLPKVCNKTIELIGERTKNENRTLLVKQLIIFGLLMSVLLSVFLYFF